MAPFKSEFISESVLQRLIKKDIVVDLHVKDPQASNTVIFKSGQPVDYFVLILQVKFFPVMLVQKQRDPTKSVEMS